MSERWEVGDLVTPNKRIKGLRNGHIYRIDEIRRGIDGAFDWDDIYLESIPVIRYKNRVEGQFCEFDFKRAGV